jgi:hypothetical protein
MVHELVAKREVYVGETDERGTFLGRIVRFTGEVIGTWTDHTAASEGEDRGLTYTLYAVGPDQYRVHIREWTKHAGEIEMAWLEPWEGDPEGDVTFGTFTEDEARARHGKLFAVLGRPNVVELD